MEVLTIEDCNFILESLQYTKRNFENCNSYPSYQFKLDRIGEVETLIEKLRKIRKDMKSENPIK